MRGVDSKFEYSRSQTIRDTRPLGQRFADAAGQPTWAVVGCSTMGLALLLVPDLGALSDLVLLIAGGYFWWFRWLGRRYRLPLRMPIHAGCKDPGDPKQSGVGFYDAAGILFVGNDRQTGDEIWLKNEDARQHILYLGTTGAGKSEGLKSLVANGLMWGSGFIFVDGKADTKLWGDIRALVRRFGRDDDLRILNYITGNSDTGGVSNTLNPFAFGAAGTLSELIVSLMAEAGSDPMWKERAVGLVKAVATVLAWLRDNRGLPLDAGVFRRHLVLAEIIKLSRRKDIPEEMRMPLQAYLAELPGYEAEAFDDDGNVAVAPNRQPPDLSTVREQHNFLTMQLTRALGSLNDDYGYIFRVQLADIDMRDVVLNRRVLVVLLPALEKSPDELANLGKIIVANLKGMMAATLGSAVEGEWDEAIENKPTNSPSPYQVIFDEVGYYTVPGMAVMAAQARSLGFSLVFAGQDVPALRKRVQEEADSIIGNCNLQLWGRLTDPGATKELFESSVGKVLVSQASGYSAMVGSASINYSDRLDASIEEVARADWLDIKAQVEGQVHLTFADRLIRTSLFYAAPKKVRALRVGRFLQIKADAGLPEGNALSAEVRALVAKLRDPEWRAALTPADGDTPAAITAMADAFGAAVRSRLSALEGGCVAVAALGERLDEKADRLKAAFVENAPPAPAVPEATMAPVRASERIMDRPPPVALSTAPDGAIVQRLGSVAAELFVAKLCGAAASR